jgi:malate dehydrogenase
MKGVLQNKVAVITGGSRGLGYAIAEAYAVAWDAVGDEAWIADEFIPTVGKRGAAIIEARGSSSAASAASAAIDHIRDWSLGTPDGDWVSMAVPSTGTYGIEAGIFCGQPCTASGGGYSVVEGLEVNDFSRERIDASVGELREERDSVSELGLI